MNTKNLFSSTLMFIVFSSILNAQAISGCDFFPKNDTIIYTYTEKSEGGLLGNSFKKFELKYIYTREQKIKDKVYKVYSKYTDGEVPEVNQEIFVHCDGNSLIVGNEVYSFNREVVGEMRDITKVVDFYATPVYEVSMQPTGTYYLPTILNLNNETEQSWSMETELHGSLVSIVSNLIAKNISIEINGKEYGNVYHVRQKLYKHKNLITEKDVFFAKNIGMIKTVSTSKVLGREIKNVLELYNSESINSITKEIEGYLEQLPKGARRDDYKRFISYSDALPPNKQIETLNKLKKEIIAYLEEENNKNNIYNDYEKFKKQIQNRPAIIPDLIGTWKEKKRGISHWIFYKEGYLKRYGVYDSKKTPNIPKEKFWYTVSDDGILEVLYENREANGYPNYKKYRLIMKDKNTLSLELIFDYFYENYYKKSDKKYYNNNHFEFIKQ